MIQYFNYISNYGAIYWPYELMIIQCFDILSKIAKIYEHVSLNKLYVWL